MNSLRVLLLSGLAAISSFEAAFANSPRAGIAQAGLIGVVPDQYQGRQTASGEIYNRAALSAAHSTLPLGTMVRVAHFATGKMVDVRVNDRKPTDSTLLHLSGAAARSLGILSNASVQGSIMVVGTAPGAHAPIQQAAIPGPSVGQMPGQPMAPVDNQVQKPFRPFSSLKQDEAMRKAVNNPNAVASTVPSAYPGSGVAVKTGLFGKQRKVQYGIPSNQYEPVSGGASGAPKKNIGEVFAGIFNRNKQAGLTPQAPAGGIPNNAVIPMSVPSPQQNQVLTPAPNRAAVPGPETVAQRRAPVTTPLPAAPAVPTNPYRVQFGAFKSYENAREMSASLNKSGVGTMVAPANGRNLHLVITNGGFPSAEQAQGWINMEAARRGWRERPVVIR